MARILRYGLWWHASTMMYDVIIPGYPLRVDPSHPWSPTPPAGSSSADQAEASLSQPPSTLVQHLSGLVSHAILAHLRIPKSPATIIAHNGGRRNKQKACPSMQEGPHLMCSGTRASRSTPGATSHSYQRESQHESCGSQLNEGRAKIALAIELAWQYTSRQHSCCRLLAGARAISLKEPAIATATVLQELYFNAARILSAPWPFLWVCRIFSPQLHSRLSPLVGTVRR